MSIRVTFITLNPDNLDRHDPKVGSKLVNVVRDDEARTLEITNQLVMLPENYTSRPGKKVTK